MILNLIVFKNVAIQAYTTPNFIDQEPEIAAKQLERSIVLNFGKRETEVYQNLDMYFIGTFDDESGKFDIVEPKFLFSPRELMIQIATKRAQALGEEKKEEVPAV